MIPIVGKLIIPKFVSIMKRLIIIITTAVFFRLFLVQATTGASAESEYITEDFAKIALGEASFNENCSGCHNFRMDGIGPQLGGLTTQVSTTWIKHFVRNPAKVIKSGDKRARALVTKFKVVMPSFPSLKEDELNNIVAFLNTQKKPAQLPVASTGKEMLNPIPEPVSVSNLVGNLEVYTQIPASSDSGKLPLARISKLDFQPGKDNMFILDLRGKLYQMVNRTPSVYMDMAQLKPAFVNTPGLATGFGSFAFHPDFEKNGLLYTTHTEPPGSAKADFSYPDLIKVTLQWVVTEWKTQNPNAATFSGTGRELLRINVVTGIHGVQEITFNPLSRLGNEDYGKLYIGVGDGGSVKSGYPFLAHNRERVWGTVLRIDPAGRNSVNGQYGIPPENPFARDPNPNILKEIYAYGFRNPHRITWSLSGQMLLCNVGHGNIELVNLVLPGHDYGWPIREGTFVLNPLGDLNKVFPLPADDLHYNVTYPVVEYDHDEGLAISGGFEYTGGTIPALKGKFLFGDIPSGRLFYVEMSDIKLGKQAMIKEWKISINGKPVALKDVCGSGRVDLHFGRDRSGEIYLLTKADGKVYKLVGASVKSAMAVKRVR